MNSLAISLLALLGAILFGFVVAVILGTLMAVFELILEKIFR